MSDNAIDNKATWIHVVHSSGSDRDTLSNLLIASGHKVRCFSDPHVFLAEVDSSAAGCVLLEMDLTTAYYPDVLRELAARESSLAVVTVPEQATISAAVEAMKLGAIDVVEKLQWAAVLAQVVEGGLAASSRWSAIRMQAIRSKRRLQLLTQREREVLAEILDGHSSKATAHQLGISVRTIDIHRANVMRKLGAKSVADAMAIQIWAEMPRMAICRYDPVASKSSVPPTGAAMDRASWMI